MEKHASHRKKACYVDFLQKVLKKKAKPKLESGQNILGLFCLSDGWRELFTVINKSVRVWVSFKIQLQTKGSIFNFH